MTYSLVAACRRTGQVGVGAMTAMLGVGKLVAHARPRVGAAASQAFLNPYLAIDGLRLLADGTGAREACAKLIGEDPGRDGRQFGIVGMNGESAAWTGSAPDDWKGHRTGDGWACQGNRLAGPEVLDAAIEAFLAREDDDLVRRLLAALDAGEGAGGDTKGHRSATIYILDTEEYPLWDLRIDHSDAPLRDLHRLYEDFDRDLISQVRKLPTRDNPVGDFDFATTEEAV